MALQSRIDNDIKAALLGGDRFRVDVLRSLKAVILNEAVAKGQRDAGLGDDVIEQLIAKEVKKRHDSVQQYTSAGRPELAQAEADEAKLLEAYLPEQLSESDIQKTIDEIITTFNLHDIKQMGQVIKATKEKLGNTADGATVARLVKNSLN